MRNLIKVDTVIKSLTREVMPRFEISSEYGMGRSKTKINKICANTKFNLVDALRLALMSYHMQANRMSHLTRV